MSIPEEVKFVSNLVSRASELENVEPSISYWTRCWIVQRIISHPQSRNAAVDHFLTQMLDTLETTKSKYRGTSEIEDASVGKRKVEAFARTVFENADREERARRANKSTAVKFLAAAAFLEVCQVFGTPDKDLIDKRKYAKAQAMRIQGAILAGRSPNAARKHDIVSQSEERSDEQFVESSVQLAPASGAKTDGPHDPELKPRQESLPAGSPLIIHEGTVQPMPDHMLPQRDMSTLDCLDISAQAGPPSDQRTLATSPSQSDGKNAHQERYSNTFGLDRNLSPDDIPTMPQSDRGGSARGDLKAASPVSLESMEGAPQTIVESSPNNAGPSRLLTLTDMEASQKHAKWAISALNYEDVDTAISELKRSLNALGVNL